jgi:hypothetical protein
VAALQDAGCRIVQVDEPALREGLPLKHAKWDSYLSWAVDAFRWGLDGGCCGEVVILKKHGRLSPWAAVGSACSNSSTRSHKGVDYQQ